MTPALTFSCLFTALLVGHSIGHRWVAHQVTTSTHRLPGWLAELTHAATYLLGCAIPVEVICWRLELDVAPGYLLAALVIATMAYLAATPRISPRRTAVPASGSAPARCADISADLADRAWCLTGLFVAALVAA